MEDNRLLHEKISTLFITFVLPSVIAEVICGIQGIVDGIFIGNFVSANAMSSINIVSPYVSLSIGFIMVVCTGTVSYLGRAIGGNDLVKAKDIFKSSLVGLGVLIATIALIGFVEAKPIALLLGANEVLLADAITYIRVYVVFVPFLAFMNLFGFVNRLLGKPQLYLYGTISCLIANVIADYIVVKVLNLGVAGAAFATGFAYIVGFVIVAGPLFKRDSIVNIFDGHYYWPHFKELSINGSSEGIGSASMAITVFLFNAAFMHYVGEDGIAAFAIISYIGNFTSLAMFGISDGIVSIASCNYGAKAYDRVRKTFYSAVIVNFVLGAICCAILVFFNRPIIEIFLQDNPIVLDIASAGSIYYAFSFLLVGFNILQSGFNTAVGNAYASLLISGLRGVVFNFIGIMILPRMFELTGVWMTFPFAEIATSLVCVIIMFNKKQLYFKIDKE